MKPNNKIDKLLANIGGEEYEVTPRSAREFFLKEIDERVDADEAAIAAANGRIDGINAVPDYTVSDAGKVLTVTTDNVPANLVPEQEITLNTAGAAIANPNTGITLTAGKAVTISGELWKDSKLDTLTAEAVEVTVENDTPYIVLVGATYIYNVNCSTWKVDVTDDDTHTTLDGQYSLVKFKIDTTVTEADAEWAAVPSDLPASTVIDEGKVLTVNSSGAPAWSTPSGGAFVVTFSGTTAGGDAACDHTWEDILNATTPIMARYTDSLETPVYMSLLLEDGRYVAQVPGRPDGRYFTAYLPGDPITLSCRINQDGVTIGEP